MWWGREKIFLVNFSPFSSAKSHHFSSKWSAFQISFNFRKSEKFWFKKKGKKFYSTVFSKGLFGLHTQKTSQQLALKHPKANWVNMCIVSTHLKILQWFIYIPWKSVHFLRLEFNCFRNAMLHPRVSRKAGPVLYSFFVLSQLIAHSGISAWDQAE